VFTVKDQKIGDARARAQVARLSSTRVDESQALNLVILQLPVRASPNLLLVGTARIDRSGRIYERNLLRALGWQLGRRLDLDTVHGMLVLAPNHTWRAVAIRAESAGIIGADQAA
jgi:hypothetical protein